MNRQRKIKLIQYGICGSVCLLLAAVYLISNDFLSLGTKDLLRILCDAFTIPGLLCVFAGLLVWGSNEGAFDGVGYVLSYAFHALIPGNIHPRESYRDYLERKRGKRVAGYGFLFVCGGICILLALLFLILFHQM